MSEEVMMGEKRVAGGWRRGKGVEGGSEEREEEVKGEMTSRGQRCSHSESCLEHSSTSLQSFQFTDSLENRMNDWSEPDRREEIKRG